MNHSQLRPSYSITFHSYTEPHLATDNELVRNILVSLLSSLAKVEAQKISDCMEAGMARAKAKGIKVGRPKLAIDLRQQIARRVAKGETSYAIAKALDIDHTSCEVRGLRVFLIGSLGSLTFTASRFNKIAVCTLYQKSGCRR